MDDYREMPFAEWLEETAKAVIGFKPDSIGLLAVRDDGMVFTTYYNADVTDLCIFQGQVQQDIILETIRNNAPLVKDYLTGGDVT